MFKVWLLASRPKTFIAIATLSLCTSAVPDGARPDAESLRAPYEAGRSEQFKETRGEAFFRIRDTFRVPINFEGIPEEGRATELTPHPGPNFRIHRDETLQSALDRFIQESDDRLKYSRIASMLCVYPSRFNEMDANHLDTVVSINVEDVSVWEAVCELARIVNDNSSEPRPFYIIPAGPESVRAPVSAFTNDKSISVKATNVSAREALCRILGTSPVIWSYFYVYSNDYDYVTTFAHDSDNKVMFDHEARSADVANVMAAWNFEDVIKLQSR